MGKVDRRGSLKLRPDVIAFVEGELAEYPETRRWFEKTSRQWGEKVSRLEYPPPGGVTVLALERRLQYVGELLAVIEEVVNALPEAQRRFVRLHYWERKPLAEVAEELGYSRRQVYNWRRQIVGAIALRLGKVKSA